MSWHVSRCVDRARLTRYVAGRETRRGSEGSACAEAATRITLSACAETVVRRWSPIAATLGSAAPRLLAASIPVWPAHRRHPTSRRVAHRPPRDRARGAPRVRAAACPRPGMRSARHAVRHALALHAVPEAIARESTAQHLAEQRADQRAAREAPFAALHTARVRMSWRNACISMKRGAARPRPVPAHRPGRARSACVQRRRSRAARRSRRRRASRRARCFLAQRAKRTRADRRLQRPDRGLRIGVLAGGECAALRFRRGDRGLRGLDRILRGFQRIDRLSRFARRQASDCPTAVQHGAHRRIRRGAHACCAHARSCFGGRSDSSW